MLQNLGSSTNAKIAYCMFIGCCILIILTIVFVATFERTTPDETYAFCATAYYSPKTRYRIEYWGQRNDFEIIDTGCARACYKEQKYQNGLSFLEIETQSGYADVNQAVAAGILEGTLTWMSIYAQWKNTIESFCVREEKFCIWLRSIILRNKANIMSITKRKHHSSHYQHQIMLFYQQLEGLEMGFRKGVKRARRDYEIPSTDFLLLNARVDIEDLIIYYNKYVEEDENNFVDLPESAEKMIVKLVMGEHPKIFLGHSSDGDYNSMLKIVKTYRFNYHQGPSPSDFHLVANTDITFTSYPGIIASTDDFYLAHGKHSQIIVSGIKLKFNQATQVHAIDIDAAVLMSVRVMAANRLAHNGKSWAKIMARDPDIGAKQWLVIDEKHLKYLEMDDGGEEIQNEFVISSSTVDDGLTDNDIPVDQPHSFDKEKAASLTSQITSRNIVWLIDNTWKRLHAEDVTRKFKRDGEWTLDGTPYFKVIQELNRIDGKDLNQYKMQNIEDVEDVASALQNQAFRGDLKRDGPGPFGNTDIKVYSSDDNQFLVQNGPFAKSEDDIFEWAGFEDVSHDELPGTWNFPSVFVHYVWN